MNYKLVDVERFPKILDDGVVYWSQEFEMSAHKCACGCGDVIYLPVDPANYKISVSERGITLRPSVGNWGVCDAHYLITNGEVVWAQKWSPEEIKTSRAREDARRAVYYAPRNISLPTKFMNWIRSLLKRN
jgi:Family of unknown function (DUF6527)